MANCITGLRMLGTLVLLGLVPLSPAFYGVYALTGVTDALDGWVARKTGTASPLGARLDSCADLLFYAVMIGKLFPVLYEVLPQAIWLAVLGSLVCACAPMRWRLSNTAPSHLCIHGSISSPVQWCF